MLQDKDIPALDEEHHGAEPQASIPDDADVKSLQSQVTGLIDDVRTLAYAEVEYYRAKLSVNLAATKNMLVLFGLALVVGTMGVIALILGLLLILSEHVGSVAATGITTGSALLVAAIMMSMAIKRAKKLPLDENDA
ncbi:phage holin family protein [Parasphingorhabdus sp.]|uniref:phage holin family protein n=1 Tax=Parasphingorhabdus sp. TaxID=2709688 RepID=UPI003A91A86E